MNTGIFSGRVSKGFIAWRNFAEKNPDLPVGFVIQGGTATELPDEVVARLTRRPSRTPSRRPGRRSFRSLVPMEEDASDGRRSNSGGLRVSQQAGRSRPWSPSRTPTLSSRIRSAGDRFVDWIPTVADQVKIEGAAHFLQEDRGELIAGEILRFLDSA